MPIELRIPEVGESITKVEIAEWLKAEGDSVQKDEAVAVIDSEKTTFELPASASGTLSKILRKAGETVQVGEVIGHLNGGAPSAAPAGDKPAAKSANDAAPAKAPDAGAKELGAADLKLGNEDSRPPDSDSEESKDEAEEAASPEEKSETSPVAKPAAPRAAKASATKTSGDGEEEIVPMSMLRRTVARRLVEAKQQMAMLTTFNEVDMSGVQALRQEHKEAFEKRYGVKLGFMSFFVKAAVDALKQVPQLNAEVRGNDIVYHNFFNIGVAVATERGLVVPVLRHAERLSFADVEKAIGEFATRAKESKLIPDELEGATFTITNGGVFGSLLSTPIINPPQSGILGLHTIQERPVALDGQVVIRPMMYLALTYDHRIVDGREAVLFLRRIKEVIENVARMLVEV